MYMYKHVSVCIFSIDEVLRFSNTSQSNTELQLDSNGSTSKLSQAATSELRDDAHKHRGKSEVSSIRHFRKPDCDVFLCY